MYILHIIASVNPAGGGPIEGIIRAAECWADAGYVREIVSLDSPSDPWVKSCPVRTHALGVNRVRKQSRASSFFFRYGYSPSLAPWLKQNVKRYDAVIVNGLWNYASLAAWRALRTSDVPYFVYTHGMLDPWFRLRHPIKHVAKQLLWFFAEGKLLSNASAVYFTSEEEKVRSRNVFFPYRIRESVAEYGTTDLPEEQPAQRDAFVKTVSELYGRHYILHLGRIHPIKGCDILLRAFARVAAEYPNLVLVMAGPDDLKWSVELRASATKAGIGSRVLWPGMLTGPAKWGALREAQCFVLPSHHENFGMAVVEALAAAAPVLISTKVNIWREIRDAEAGIIFENTVDDLESALRGFLKLLPEQQRELGSRGRKLFLTKYELRSSLARSLKHMKDEIEAAREARKHMPKPRSAGA